MVDPAPELFWHPNFHIVSGWDVILQSTNSSSPWMVGKVMYTWYTAQFLKKKKTCIVWTSPLRVCLVWQKSGRMENIGWILGWKFKSWVVWWGIKWEGRENGRDKNEGEAHNILSSQYWKEKWRGIFLSKQSRANYSFVHLVIKKNG